MQNAVQACPFCMQGKGPTLLDDFNGAMLVVEGTVTDSKVELSGEFEGGTSKFKVGQVFKDNDVRKGKSEITLPKYLKVGTKYVLFCDVYKGAIDPYRGVQMGSDGELIHYLAGAIKLKGVSVPERLKYCFKFLNSKDLEVSMDAFREFANAAYTDYKDVAEHFDAEALVEWLNDPETPTYRFGLYASLLGHCGEVKHIPVLKAMITDPKKRDSTSIDGMFAGYVFLLHRHHKDKEALDFLRTTLGDNGQEFLMRWASLKTLRFMRDNRPDIFSKSEITAAVALGMKHKDMADFAIEDLRKWKCWEMTDEVLAVFTKPSHKATVIKRAVLRFALQCPEPAAKAFVAEQRKINPKWVAETEELLNLEKGFNP
jgi:hypothetical protein